MTEEVKESKKTIIKPEQVEKSKQSLLLIIKNIDDFFTMVSTKLEESSKSNETSQKLYQMIPLVFILFVLGTVLNSFKMGLILAVLPALFKVLRKVFYSEKNS